MKFRKNIRLKDYDYRTNGYYFVTICYSKTANVANVAAERSSARKQTNVAAEQSSAKKQTNVAAERSSAKKQKYKEIILKHLRKLEENQGVKLDYFVIMPTHLHFILVLEEAKLPLCRYIQDFKAKATLEIKRNGFSGKRFFQPNYYEHIIRNEKALDRIRKYIKENPDKGKINFKQFYEE